MPKKRGGQRNWRTVTVAPVRTQLTNLEHVVVEAATDAIMPEWTGNFDLGKMDGFVYFRHPMSRVIHATADESGTHFLCGRDVSTAYLRMTGRPKVLHRTCKQCFGRNLIKDRVG